MAECGEDATNDIHNAYRAFSSRREGIFEAVRVSLTQLLLGCSSCMVRCQLIVETILFYFFVSNTLIKLLDPRAKVLHFALDLLHCTRLTRFG